MCLKNIILRWMYGETKAPNSISSWRARNRSKIFEYCSRIVATSVNKAKKILNIFWRGRKKLGLVLNSGNINILPKLARYCNFERLVISFNLPNRSTILTCGKRTVVFCVICKIYNYISNLTIRISRKVRSLKQ